MARADNQGMQTAPTAPAPPRPEPITHLLYLHGFRSSPQSAKAKVMAAWLAEHRPDVHWWCPELPPSPRQAWLDIKRGIALWPWARTAVVGSSLGGFYATAVAENTGCRALLLNPAVDPARDLEKHIGEQTQFHAPEERFFFKPDYIAELRALSPATLTRPERYGAVIAKGDEVLDWREMTARYPHAQVRLVDGSDHGLTDFEDHLPFILHFLTLTS
jgi:hypothetical protein